MLTLLFFSAQEAAAARLGITSQLPHPPITQPPPPATPLAHPDGTPHCWSILVSASLVILHLPTGITFLSISVIFKMASSAKPSLTTPAYLNVSLTNQYQTSRASCPLTESVERALEAAKTQPCSVPSLAV